MSKILSVCILVFAGALFGACVYAECNDECQQAKETARQVEKDKAEARERCIQETGDYEAC